LLAVQLGIHGSTIRDQFKVHNAIDIPPDAQHDFLAETILTSNRWRILISWNPALRTITIDQENPLSVACHNALPEPIVQRIVEQLAADFNTSYSLCFSEFVRILSWLLVGKIKLVQVIDNGPLRDSKFIGSMTARLPKRHASPLRPEQMVGQNEACLRSQNRHPRIA
jgi:hypothetical protein